jgi:8-oxo-dGTP pyrophosphatase MutT (NUDIX family)
MSTTFERNWTGIAPLPRSAGQAQRHNASRAKRIFYRIWGRLPPRIQSMCIWIGSPKVTLGACAVIRDAQGHVLLAHHTYRRRAWGLPGGLAGSDEQPHEALARELREELGVHSMIGPLLHADISETNGHLTLYYAATISGTPRHDGVEIDGYRYVAPDEAAALLGADNAPWLEAA